MLCFNIFRILVGYHSDAQQDAFASLTLTHVEEKYRAGVSPPANHPFPNSLILGIPYGGSLFLSLKSLLIFILFYYFILFFLFMTTSVTYGGFWARGGIGAAAEAYDTATPILSTSATYPIACGNAHP